MNNVLMHRAVRITNDSFVEHHRVTNRVLESRMFASFVNEGNFITSIVAFSSGSRFRFTSVVTHCNTAAANDQ
jgi:hypothetical protein